MGPGRHCRGCGRLANPIFISSYIISDVFSLGNIEIVVLMPKRYTFGSLMVQLRRADGTLAARKRSTFGSITARLQSPPEPLKIGEFCHAEYRRFGVDPSTALRTDQFWPKLLVSSDYRDELRSVELSTTSKCTCMDMGSILRLNLPIVSAELPWIL